LAFTNCSLDRIIDRCLDCLGQEGGREREGREREGRDREGENERMPYRFTAFYETPLTSLLLYLPGDLVVFVDVPWVPIDNDFSVKGGGDGGRGGGGHGEILSLSLPVLARRRYKLQLLI
jgi:hypothetical protein